MFYSESDIISELKCPICKDIFDVPKLLPCGNAICNQCILNLELTKQNNEFKCSLCSESHQIPRNGFSICKPLVKLLSKSSNPIYRGEHVEKLCSMIKFVENELKKLEFDLNNGVDVIKDHCIELRRQIQLTTETKIQELELNSDKLLKLINDFEQQTILAYNQTNRTRLNKRLIEYKQAYEESNKYLEKNEINEQMINRMNCNLMEIKSKLAIDKQEIKSLIFNGQLIDFRKASSEQPWNQIGTIRIVSFNTIDFNQFYQIDLDRCFRKSSESKYFRFGFFDNGNILIACGSTRLKLLILSADDKSIKKYKKIEEFQSLNNVLISKDRIVVQYRKNKNQCCLKLFDKNLDILHQIDNFQYMLIGVNDSYIYCGSSSSNRVDPTIEEDRLVIYNYSLKVIKTIGQKDNPLDAFYFPNGIADLRCENRKYYFINNDYTLRIIDKSSGHLLGSLKLKQSQFYKIDSNGNIVVIELSTDVCGKVKLKLKYITSKGEVYKKINLINFPQLNNILRYFSFDKNDKICFFNYEDLSLYFEDV